MRLDGTKVFLTGTFDRSREDLVAELEARGAQIATDIDFDVEILFAGDDPGAELDGALELGVRVADAAALAAALAGEEPPAARVPDEPVRAAAASAPSDEPAQNSGPRKFGKGERVRIIGGREGIGEIGEIFWWGESKFGDGMRAGVSTEAGDKHWVDEEHLAWPDADVDEEALEEAMAANVFGRGDRVRVKSGKGEGAEGSIFWWGESKYGDGMRAGVETDDGEKLWIDAEHLEALDAEEEDSDIPF